MTKKNTNKGQSAPKSKNVAKSEILDSAESIGVVIMTTTLFGVILLALVGAGYLVHYIEHNCDWVPRWTLQVAKLVEAMLFLHDISALGWPIIQRFILKIKGGKHSQDDE